jgi:hypothetical protein
MLISAPAGFGKTTLVSEWISALTPSPLPTASRHAASVQYAVLLSNDLACYGILRLKAVDFGSIRRDLCAIKLGDAVGSDHRHSFHNGSVIKTLC